MNALQQFLQAASNEAAGTISGPVDLIGMGLRKLGVPVPRNALMSSEWMRQNGLMQDVPQTAASLGGQTFGLLSPAVVAANSAKLARGLLTMGENAAAPRRLNPQTGAIAWHGSPHKFDQFDSSKIGTGEGAQAYGHGLYLAEAPDVAKSYKDLNPSALAAPIRAFRGAELSPGSPEYHAATLVDGMGLQQARKAVAGWIKNADPRMAKEAEGWAKTLETLNAATSKADFKQLKNTGNLYKVDLPDEKIARMLDWDKPLSQQPENVRKAFAKIGADEGMTGQQAYRKAHEVAILSGKAEPAAIKEVQAVEKLRRAGIPGIRYLDGGSRSAGAGSSNFVVFPGEENALRILERNGKPIR